MALIKCKNCGREISDKAPDCIHCGALIIKDERNVVINSPELEENIILKEELLKIKNEKQILEAENSEFKNRIKENEKLFEEERNEKIELTAEKEFLFQENHVLKCHVEDSEKTISSLSQKEKSLIQQNSELKKKLSKSQKSVATLKRKIMKDKRSVSFKTLAKKASKRLLLIIRLFLMGICLIGAAVCAFSGEIGLAVWFTINAVAISPYPYQIIWNKTSVPLSFKIAVEIIIPIIASASITIFYGGE